MGSDNSTFSFEWQTLPLEDALEVLIDYRGKSPQKSQIGIPVISAKVVKGGKILHPIEQKIANDYYAVWMTRGLPQEGDVVMTTEGPMGEVAQLDRKTVKYALGQRIVCMRGKKNFLHNDFLKYLLISPQQQSILASFATGTTVEGISQKALRNIPIPIPPYADQINISAVLKSLDEKIELNQRMNETLEAMAQAIFKSWFVDFDPVKAKAEGRTPEGMDAATAALFPSRLTDASIPEGWEIVTILDILELAYGKALKSTDRIDGNFPVYGSGGITGFHNKALVKGPGIVVGRKGTIGSLYWAQKDFFPIDTVFYVLPKEGYSLDYIFLLLKTLNLPDMNTDAAVPGLNRNNVYRLEVILPPLAIIKKFDEVVRCLQKKAQQNSAENEILENLRDTILPRLISGKLKIQEVQDAPIG